MGEKETNAEKLENLRERLYARGNDIKPSGRSELSPPPSGRAVEAFPVAPKPKPKPTPPPPPPRPTPPPTPATPMAARKRKKFRNYLIAGGVIFFALAVILSTALVLFGRSTISSANLVFDVRGPVSVGGGETLELTVALTNKNAVPIESAAVIIEYPTGTQSAEREGEELFRERRPVERVGAGESINVPIRAVIFGEENEEQEILISIEYRVQGSNATFSKEAPPYRYRVSSAPVSVMVEGPENASSGSEVEFTVTVVSNGTEPMTDIVLEAQYPFGFDFTTAEPTPASGGRTWVINSLAPGEEREFTIEGLLTGDSGEEKEFTFVTGVGSTRDAFSVASVFSQQSHIITVDQVAGDVSVRVNGESGSTLTVGAGEPLSVEISFANRLDETVYDMEIEAVLSGAAFDSNSVEPESGSYSSGSGTVRWDGRTLSSLREVRSGTNRTVRFALIPDAAGAGDRTPQVTMAIEVNGRRVTDDRVSRPFTVTLAQNVRVESRAELTARTLYSTGPFSNVGPVPPRVGSVTQYTVALSVANGSNSLADTVVEATLPSGIAWLDLKQSSVGSLSYISASRTVRWQIGNLNAAAGATAEFQVSILPTQGQIGTIPTLASDIRLRATDRFTGTVLRATANEVRTSVPDDPNPDAQSGRVQSP